MNAAMCRFSLWLLLPLLLSWSAQASEPPACATTIAALQAMNGDQAFPLKWKEISMDDGQPLRVSILEKNGVLAFEFVKSGRGLWAETAGAVCRSGADVEIRFTGEQIRFGPAASWILRVLLGNGGTFTLTRLGPAQLRIATRGWHGDFVPGD